MFKKILLLTLLVCCTEKGLARKPITRESNPSSIEYQLLTAGLGSGIEARYGHTIIRMIDRDTGRESNINWGMFNFADPYLPLNFFLGQLKYWVTDESSRYLNYRYQKYEQRPLVAEKINLTAKQKHALFALIMENLEPENKYFWYQYFYKNCATIPRDYLDQVLHGQLGERFKDQFSSTKFREYVRVNLNKPPIIAFFLDIVMNSRLDAPLSKWTEMFYPPKLREHLLTLEAIDDEGQSIAGTKLLSDTRVISNQPDVKEDPWTIHPWFLGLSLFAFATGLALSKAQKFSAYLHRCGKVLLFLCLLFWFTFSGVFGLIMTISWLFSSHLDLHHNANLFLLWPIDLLFVVPSGLLLFARKHSSLTQSILRLAYGLAAAHLFVIPVWVAGCLSGIIAQNCNLVMLYIAPVAGLSYLFIGYKCRERILEK